jgi:hypothetical protein
MEPAECFSLLIDLVALALKQVEDRFAVLLLCSLNDMLWNRRTGPVREGQCSILEDRARHRNTGRRS